jgi:basic membrane protein A
VLLTSVLKNTQDAMVEIVGEVQDGSFSNEPYIGTLENGGVEIAPYHDLASLVTPELDGEIEGLRQAIIAGELVIDSPSAP